MAEADTVRYNLGGLQARRYRQLLRISSRLNICLGVLVKADFALVLIIAQYIFLFDFIN